MAIKGTLSESFLDGQNDCAFAIDWEFLTEEEQDLILNFLLEISHKEYVIGKNK